MCFSSWFYLSDEINRGCSKSLRWIILIRSQVAVHDDANFVFLRKIISDDTRLAKRQRE